MRGPRITAALAALAILAVPAAAAAETIALECGALEAPGVHVMFTGDLGDPSDLGMSAWTPEKRWTLLPSVFHPDAVQVTITSITREPPFLLAEFSGGNGDAVSLRLAELPDPGAKLFAGVVVLPTGAYVMRCLDLAPALEAFERERAMGKP
jgi:hypothetical protein